MGGMMGAMRNVLDGGDAEQMALMITNFALA
jgi:hypothetical protein